MKARLLVLVAAVASGYLTVALTGCNRTRAPAQGQVGVRVVRGQHPDAEQSAASEAEIAQAARTGDGQPPGFVFADDRGGELLAGLLTPSGRLPPGGANTRTRSRHAGVPRAIQSPELSRPIGLAPLPQPPVGPGRVVSRPRPLVDEPLPRAPQLPNLPERPRVPDGGRIRLPGPDANQPVPLPLLAVPRGDRAPLDDPTLDASGAAALAEVLPARATPAPFLRLNLPDPFENRAAVRLRTALPEEAVPPPTAPRLPRP